MSIKISKEIKALLLVVMGILLFYVGFNFLKNKSIFSNQEMYHTIFDFNALSVNSSVTVYGNKVGKVEDIQYNFETGKTIVSFSIDPRLYFPVDSYVNMYETGLMGGNALAIVQGTNLNRMKVGDTVPSQVQLGLVSSLKNNISGLSSDLDHTIVTADTLLYNLNTFLTDKSDKGLKSTLVELNKTLTSFRYLSQDVRTLIKTNNQQINSLVSNFETISNNLITVSEDLKEMDIKKTMNSLEGALTHVNLLMEKIDNGEGSLGKLMNDDGLYHNLENASKEMEELLRDFKLNPKRYIHFSVFGKKPKTYNAEGVVVEEKQ